MNRLDYLRTIAPEDLTTDELIELGELEALAQSNYFLECEQ